MADRETVHILCENGSVMVHDLPLPWGIRDRIDKGLIRLVDPRAGAVAIEAPAPAEESAPAAEPEAPAADAPEEPAAPKKTTRAKAE